MIGVRTRTLWYSYKANETSRVDFQDLCQIFWGYSSDFSIWTFVKNILMYQAPYSFTLEVQVDHKFNGLFEETIIFEYP